jgi:hypothetical protein
VIRFLLDGNIVTTPDGWEDLKSKIKRDNQLQAVLIFQEASVQFTADGYDYLYNKLLTEGFCSVVDLVVERTCTDGATWKTLFKGRIFVSDCEFNERTCKANAKLEDNSFYSLIKNNSKIKTALDTDLTKNGEPLTQAPVYEVDFYSVGANALVKTDVQCMRVYDAFKYLISFMSDNEIGFESTLFDVGGDWEGLAITTGERIRTGANPNWLQVDFNTLFKEVYNATEPLLMIIENPYTTPTIRIERQSYTFATAVNLICGSVYDIKTSVEQEKLYSSIKVGSSLIDNTNLPTRFPDLIDLFGFKEEELYVVGKCNIDNVLDIAGEFARGSNIIDIQLTGQDYDQTFFLIHTEYISSTSGRTTNTNSLGENPPLYYYNDALRNNNILDRWTGGLPNSLVKYIGEIGDGLFEAVSAANQQKGFFIPALSTPLQFTNESYDASNSWSTNTYTAPEAGAFYFEFQGTITPDAPSTSGQLRIFIRVYDAGNNYKYHVDYNIPYILTGTQTLNRKFRVFMNETDYCQLFISYVSNLNPLTDTCTIDSGAFFRCTANTIGGAAYNTYDPSIYPVFTYDFEYPITDDEFDVLVANPIGRIAFNMENQPFRYGWIKESLTSQSSSRHPSETTRA